MRDAMMMIMIQNNTLLERAQSGEGCESDLRCHTDTAPGAPPSTDHLSVFPHTSLVSSRDVSTHIPPGISTVRHAPAHSRHGENSLRDKAGTRDTFVIHTDIWREESQDKDAVMEIRLSHSEESRER